jgi:hypothetical protein
MLRLWFFIEAALFLSGKCLEVWLKKNEDRSVMFLAQRRDRVVRK